MYLPAALLSKSSMKFLMNSKLKCMKSKIFVEVISYLTILLFLYTSINKIIDFSGFELDISQSFGWFWGPIITIAIPAGEIIISIALFIPKFQKIGLYAALAMMFAFTLYVGYMLLFLTAHDRPCPCGGIIRKMSWPQHLIFNIIFTTLLLFAVLVKNKILTSNTLNRTKMSFT